MKMIDAIRFIHSKPKLANKHITEKQSRYLAKRKKNTKDAIKQIVTLLKQRKNNEMLLIDIAKRMDRTEGSTRKVVELMEHDGIVSSIKVLVGSRYFKKIKYTAKTYVSNN